MSTGSARTGWRRVCPVDEVPVDRGVAALIDGHPVAVFRLSGIDGGAEEWHCVDHLDPISGAPVMARGLVGSVGSPPLVVPTVASPIHKERYNLRSGVCLDNGEIATAVHEIDEVNGDVMVRLR